MTRHRSCRLGSPSSINGSNIRRFHLPLITILDHNWEGWSMLIIFLNNLTKFPVNLLRGYLRRISVLQQVYAVLQEVWVSHFRHLGHAYLWHLVMGWFFTWYLIAEGLSSRYFLLYPKYFAQDLGLFLEVVLDHIWRVSRLGVMLPREHPLAINMCVNLLAHWCFPANINIL